MASTAEQLSGQSEQLEEMISFFKMREHAVNDGGKKSVNLSKPKIAQLEQSQLSGHRVSNQHLDINNNDIKTDNGFEKF